MTTHPSGHRSARRFVAVACLVAATVSCWRDANGPASDFRPTATVEDIMRLMIDPAADCIWDAVVTDVTTDGVVETRPETAEEWAALGGHGVTLVEASNLLLIEGRAIAAPGSRSDLPGIDLHPDAIETLVADDRDGWTELAHGLHDAGLSVLAAVRARDADALLVSGTDLDMACENCHARFWYPGYGDPRPDASARDQPTDAGNR